MVMMMVVVRVMVAAGVGVRLARRMRES